jgi:hypothetical protein
MKKRLLFICAVFYLSLPSLGGDGQVSNSYPFRLSSFRLRDDGHGGPSTSRFNLKIQPAFFWATIGLEAEYIVSAKMSVALNLVGKYAQMDAKNNIHNLEEQAFLDNGYMAELIGRYFITLSKRNLGLAPTGFYVQASVGYSKLLYFDGSVRPFSLHTRVRPQGSDVSSPSSFSQPQPFIGGIGAGYQLELLHNKVIANFLVGAQAGSDNKGIFLTFYVSPSIGMMF